MVQIFLAFGEEGGGRLKPLSSKQMILKVTIHMGCVDVIIRYARQQIH